MKVVYSLSSLQGDKGVIMENERYFSNGYLFDVNVNNEALLSSNTLPVTVTVYNTGTSPISNVTPTINGQTFNLEESWVQPLSYRDFSIEYPIDDNFSGYLETSVKVDYRNVFRAKYHALHRSRSLICTVIENNSDIGVCRGILIAVNIITDSSHIISRPLRTYGSTF
jgi:hypothetical protein